MAGKRDVPATRRGSNVRREGEGPRGIRDRGARTWRSRGGSRLSEGARGERECPWGWSSHQGEGGWSMVSGSISFMNSVSSSLSMVSSSLNMVSSSLSLVSSDAN